MEVTNPMQKSPRETTLIAQIWRSTRLCSGSRCIQNRPHKRSQEYGPHPLHIKPEIQALSLKFKICKYFFLLIQAYWISHPSNYFELRHRNNIEYRSQWPCSLRRRSAATRLLGLWVWSRRGAWMSLSCECCALSGRRLCWSLVQRSPTECNASLWKI